MPKITYTGYLIFRRVPLSSFLNGTCYLRKNTLEKRNLSFRSGTGRLLYLHDPDRRQYLFPELEDGDCGIVGTARILPHCGLLRESAEEPE